MNKFSIGCISVFLFLNSERLCLLILSVLLSSDTYTRNGAKFSKITLLTSFHHKIDITHISFFSLSSTSTDNTFNSFSAWNLLELLRHLNFFLSLFDSNSIVWSTLTKLITFSIRNVFVVILLLFKIHFIIFYQVT